MLSRRSRFSVMALLAFLSTMTGMHLELACDANAPVKMIKFLADTTCNLGFPVSNMAERILTERN